MKTGYDWITLIIFAGLVTRFLHQSSRQDARDDPIWHYLIPSVGCALGNWLGNEGFDLAAIAVITATLAYIAYFFRARRGHPGDH
jgi:hypothetical protein